MKKWYGFPVWVMCAALLVAFAPLRAAADYEKGVEARAAGDYEDALHEWMAASGDVRCMTAIGSLYDYGEGFPQDDVKAAEWYMKAAEKGEYRAIAQLANFSLTGAGGVAQDPAPWRARLEEIEGRDGYADYILASFYMEGHGGGKNLEKAHAILDALVNKKGYGQLLGELQRAGELLADWKAGVLDAEDMTADIGNDRAAFNGSYKDRRVTVKGVVSSVERLNDNGYVISIGASAEKIAAVFYGSPEEAPRPGAQVKFSGVYVGDQPFPLGECAFTLFGCSLADAASEGAASGGVASADRFP